MPTSEPFSSPGPEHVAPTPPPDPAVTSATDSAAAMPNKPRTNSRSGRTRQQPPRSPWTSLLLILGVAGTFCAVMFGLYYSLRLARTYVTRQDRYGMSLKEIEVTPLPIWIHGDLLAEVQQLSGLPDRLNTLDQNLSQQVHDAFAMHPWVHDVVEVRVTRPSRIRVKLTFRE